MSAAKQASGASALTQLSAQLATAVETAANSIVSIHARRRIPSSGVIWRSGVIVSASHTVRRDDHIPVTLPGGEQVSATIAGRDTSTDLIALRADLGSAPTARRPDDADDARVPVGSLVLAVGRPGSRATASFGIVSAVVGSWRSWRGARIDGLLRLDLSIYDGFSGGALVDASGSLLGLNNSALAHGTPMAIPSAVVDRVVDELVERGHVQRSFLGVAVHPVALSPTLAEKERLTQFAGLLVMSVSDRSPAAAAGILVGDVLLEAAGQTLAGPTDLLDALSRARPHEVMTIRLLRGGGRVDVAVTPADRGRTQVAE